MCFILNWKSSHSGSVRASVRMAASVLQPCCCLVRTDFFRPGLQFSPRSVSAACFLSVPLTLPLVVSCAGLRPAAVRVRTCVRSAPAQPWRLSGRLAAAALHPNPSTGNLPLGGAARSGLPVSPGPALGTAVLSMRTWGCWVTSHRLCLKLSIRGICSGPGHGHGAALGAQPPSFHTQPCLGRRRPAEGRGGLRRIAQCRPRVLRGPVASTHLEFKMVLLCLEDRPCPRKPPAESEPC